MRKWILVLGLVLLVCLTNSIVLYGMENADFRNVNWGMNQKQVVKNEIEKTEIFDEDSLLCRTSVANKSCDLIYVFNKDKLYGAGYHFNIEHTNKNDFIGDYNDLKNLLIKKYGVPKKTDIIWRNDLLQDRSSEWGMAISIGHLVYYSIWENSKTEITLALKGENFEVKLMIVYKSKEYASEAISNQEKDEAENL